MERDVIKSLVNLGKFFMQSAIGVRMILFNPVIVAVVFVLVLCLLRTNVVIALTAGAVIAGVMGGLSVKQAIVLFSEGLGDSAKIALSYAILGAFASALAHSGLPDFAMSKFADALKVRACKKPDQEPIAGELADPAQDDHLVRLLLFLSIGLVSIACKNVVPVHITFIPVLIPPLLKIFDNLRVDRRAVSCIITFGVIVSYMTIPMGFGEIFLDNILLHHLSVNGLTMPLHSIIVALLVPVAGMSIGLIVALFHYRHPRTYRDADVRRLQRVHSASKKNLYVTCLAIVAVLVIQIMVCDTILSALVGFLFLSIAGVVGRKDADNVVIDGFKMMSVLSFTMLAAAGFGHVLRVTGGIDDIVHWVAVHANGGKLTASFCMLIAGFLISVGIGSSFCTVPIVASVYVPLGLQLGFSPAAIAVIVTVSGVMGDSGSPASDSVLGPVMGLNADGQHSLIRDGVVPSFLHLTIPVFLFGWIGSLFL